MFLTCYILFLIKGVTTLEKKYVNNKGADQPAQPHSLINIILYLESRIPVHATSKFSKFYLVHVAEKTALNLSN